MSFKNINLRKKLIITLSIVLIAAFAITNYINYQAAKNSIHQNLVQDSLPLVSDNIYSQI